MDILARLPLAIYFSSATYYFLKFAANGVKESASTVVSIYLVSIAIGVAVWVVTRKITTEQGLLQSIIVGAVIFGFIAIIYGVVTQIILHNGSNIGGLVILFWVLPSSSIIGGMFGAVFWVYNQRKINSGETRT